MKQSILFILFTFLWALQVWAILHMTSISQWLEYLIRVPA